MAESDPTLARYKGINNFLGQLSERLGEAAKKLNLDGAAIRGATQRLYDETGGDSSQVTDSMIEGALRVVDVEMSRGMESVDKESDDSSEGKTLQ